MAYGTSGLDVQVPDNAVVVRPQHGHAAENVSAALARALREPVAGAPLRSRVRPGSNVAVSICDYTRAQPRREMVLALLRELEGSVRDADFTVLVATGTHRGNTPAELEAMLGADLLARVEVVNHDARDADSLVWCGTFGADVPVWLNRRWVEADVRITTGFVEPHFFAGFSGGPKLVAPGLAALDTVLTLHDATRIGDPRATWAVCEGNPVHDDVRAIAAATDVTYGFDVVLDAHQRIVTAFGGDVLAMHEAAREHVRATAMVPVSDRFDIVVTSNSGFPLDQNLYQAVKGLSAAETIVKPGGLIIGVAECRDGFPAHGDFRSELTAAPTPAALLEQIAARAVTVPDQWQVQVLARVLVRARVAICAAGLSDADLSEAGLLATQDVGATVTAEVDRIARIEDRTAAVCVLPEGPQTIPYLQPVAAAL